MPKNLKGGKGHKKLKNNVHKQEKILLYKENSVDQEYAVITESFGTGMKVRFIDSKGNKDGSGINQAKVCTALTRGKMKRWKYFKGDVLLISRRDFEDNKVDVIHKYDERDINKLKYEKEINPILIKDIRINNSLNKKDEGEEILFEDEEDDPSYGLTEIERTKNLKRQQNNQSYEQIYASMEKEFNKYDNDDEIDEI